MINKEVEYRKLFKLQRRWAKHWITTSAHRAHSSTLSMREPGNQSLNFINSINDKNVSFKEKNELLLKFYNEQNQKDNCFNSYYSDCIQLMRRLMKQIESEIPIEVPKISRS